jgi:hypothetical protein
MRSTSSTNCTEGALVSVCAFSYYCDSTSNTCETKKTIGTSCIDDGECGQSEDSVFDTKEYYCNETNQCDIWPGWASVGDGCNDTSECVGGNDGYVSCVQSKCVGASEGQACQGTKIILRS